ncbi:uncharacterized protein PGTG_17706 [Puccinia graminis f. sp. tritici CRL 75-36-700-3]|uniref:Uncharacterized protein n=1 Tax=Puccinia graminis f. sp. tritici (strain CRL 75-36-700-3 / race SCCL) TaxID=418459 RepID=E3L4I1_PUCGT|nr:uncharacterized protein PGTG_17706 [Puccinia graminis f. sp. tritici CRL 75-36-700-3]EFP91456.1 hypothetical protein PGTG_17706 [Puccinia graminis f. sp. tritici CRL 75-36-700-3]
MSSRRSSYEPHPSPEALHLDEASDFRFELDGSHSHEASQNPFESADISDEKAAWDASSLDPYVIDPARDHVESNVPSSSPDFNQRPGSARSSFYSIGNNQLDSHRASRRSYMEEDSEFHTTMEDEPEGHVDYDDDGDDWGDSSTKKRPGSCCNSISIRGLLNMGAVTLLAMGLVVIFGVLPITTYQGSHRQAQQLGDSGSALGSGNNTTDTRQNTMVQRRFDDSDRNLVIPDKLTADGSLRTDVYSASNVAHHWGKWEMPVNKKWKHQHLSHVKPEKATSTNNKRSARKIIDVEL